MDCGAACQWRIDMKKIKAVDHFPLNGFGKWLNSIPVPDAGFRADAKWRHCYDMYSLAGGGSANGSVFITRMGTVLDIIYEKRTSDRPVLRQEARLEIENDLLATPRRWELYYRAESQPGKVMPETEIRKNGMFGRRDEPCAVNWGLFDAVQRMPRRNRFKTGIFTLYDHFDQPKPLQQIKYWDAFEVEMPDGKKMKLHAFEQIGRGILPIYYWVGGSGQLVAVISGIEGYILKEGGAS